MFVHNPIFVRSSLFCCQKLGMHHSNFLQQALTKEFGKKMAERPILCLGNARDYISLEVSDYYT